MKAETSSALERLQAALPLNGRTPGSFLDQYQGDVELLLSEKTLSLSAELLGFPLSTLSSWCLRKKLRFPQDRMRGGNLKTPIRTRDLTESADFWRGMAQAFKEALELILKYDDS